MRIIKLLQRLYILPLCCSSAFLASSSPGSRSRRRHVTCYAQRPSTYQHALAILAFPITSLDRIGNEAILEAVLPKLVGTKKLSVMLRCEGEPPSVASLRRYVGEVYSQLWDCVMDSQSPDLPDVIVYPANLPNAAPESWVAIQPDLDCICSQDSLTGWTSEGAQGRGQRFQSTDGVGGLDEHVAAVNSERRDRKLEPVTALHVPPTKAHTENHVVFLDDEDPSGLAASPDESKNDLFLGGAKTPPLFESVAVGGTFDGLHFGHRKLLTLAMSSVSYSGRLLIGVTADEMLTHKEFAEHIPNLEERMKGVERFFQRLAPGMMNRIKIVPIVDEFGPPGRRDQFFDALVLSHETLETGCHLNRHRVETLGLEPVSLLCTRRTEAHGMSSTALRRLRNQQSELSSRESR
jgi:cytidyltransferase-like protein